MAWSRLFCVSAQSRGYPRTSALLERFGEGGHGLLKARWPALPRAQGHKGSAEIILRHIAQSRSTRARVPSLSVWRVHVRPGVLDLLQLAQAVRREIKRDVPECGRQVLAMRTVARSQAGGLSDLRYLVVLDLVRDEPGRDPELGCQFVDAVSIQRRTMHPSPQC